MDVPIVETNDWAAGKKIREKTRLPWEKDGGRKNGERDLVGTLVHDGGQEPTSGFAGRGARPSVNPAMHKSGCEENTEPENQSRPAGDLGIRKGEKNNGIAAVVACKGTTTKQRGNCTRKKRKSYAHKGEACVEAIPTAGAQPKKPRFLNSAPDGKAKRDDEMNEFLRRSDHAGALLEPCWSARR